MVVVTPNVEAAHQPSLPDQVIRQCNGAGLLPLALWGGMVGLPLEGRLVMGRTGRTLAASYRLDASSEPIRGDAVSANQGSNPEDAGGREFSESLAAITGVLLNEETLAAILQLFVSLCRSMIEGVDGCSVSLLRQGGFTTNNATAEDVRDLDGVQYQSGKGPCVAATREGRRMNVALTEADARWPEFADAARLQDFVGVLSIPLAPRGQHLGALNLYSRTRAGFEPAAEETAQLFADQASVMLANAEPFGAVDRLNAQLREALVTRDVIRQAEGVLMARHRCSADEAFDLLREDSKRSGKKLRDVAREVVESR
jgi:ANTAR domain-containing protein/GAF domain-containing protein